MCLSFDIQSSKEVHDLLKSTLFTSGRVRTQMQHRKENVIIVLKQY